MRFLDPRDMQDLLQSNQPLSKEFWTTEVKPPPIFFSKPIYLKDVF